MRLKLLFDAIKAYNLKYIGSRNPDGHNNDGDNNDSNDRGTHDSTFVRVTPNSYVDGIGQMPAQAPGLGIAGVNTLPSPRAVSDAVMAQGTSDIPNSFGVNEFFQFFGQALTHDIAEAATGASGDAPIFGLAGLPFPINRTPFEGGVNTPREQINEETSFLDLSMVYGNNKTLTDLVRADLPGHAGQSAKLLLGADNLLPTIKQVAIDSGLTSLQVLEAYRPEGFGGLPDPANPNVQNNPASFENLFFAGDNRVNQTPLLISQQTIWAREHNYQVDKLTPYAKLYGWTQDQLFEAARAITEAEWQHVVYEEYLTKLLGQNALDEYRGYNKNVDPSVINEWTTVAFRFGHDQSSQNQKPLNEDGTAANPAPTFFTLFTLSEAFRAGADGARTGENIDQWLRGQLASHSQEIDGYVVDGNRNTLFGIGNGGGPIFADLEVFDIQRARDHGVWNYNELREGLGLSKYTDFDQFGALNNVAADRLASLKTVYGNDINKLDAIIGGLLEKKYYDSQLGETFTKLTVMQFEALRDGDKLFYENRFSKNPLILAEIENTSLADIIARNSGIDHLYRDAFAAHNRVSDTDGSISGTEGKDLAVGTDLGDLIRTWGGDDDVYAGKGNDVVFAGAGRDWLWGEDGKDTFVIEKYSGRDVVKDFNTKYDKVDLTDWGIDSWREVKSCIKTTSQGITIKLDNNSTIELVGVKKVTASNFVYDHDTDYGVA